MIKNWFYYDIFQTPHLFLCTIITNTPLSSTPPIKTPLHRQVMVIHRDLKAGNLLLDSGGNIKLGLFQALTILLDSTSIHLI